MEEAEAGAGPSLEPAGGVDLRGADLSQPAPSEVSERTEDDNYSMTESACLAGYFNLRRYGQIINGRWYVCQPINIKPARCTSQEIDNAIFYIMRRYNPEDSVEEPEDIYDFLHEQFSHWTKEMYEKASADMRHDLRTIVRRRGIYVKIARGKNMAEALWEAFKDEEMPPWDPTDKRDTQNVKQKTDKPKVRNLPVGEDIVEEIPSEEQSLQPGTGKERADIPALNKGMTTPLSDLNDQNTFPQSARKPKTPGWPSPINDPNFGSHYRGQPRGLPYGAHLRKHDATKPEIPADAELGKRSQNNGSRDDDDERYYGHDPGREDYRRGTDQRGQRQYQPIIDIPRKVADLTKMYTDVEKYGGMPEEFLMNSLHLFEDKCNRLEIPQTAFMKALPAMLKGQASLFYARSLANRGLDFTQLVGKLHRQFESQPLQQERQMEWRSLSLKKIITQNPSKPMMENLQWLINRIQELHSGLDMDQERGEEEMAETLLVAVRGIPACGRALLRPAGSFGSLSAELLQAVAVWQDEQNQRDDTFFVDRQFRGDVKGNGSWQGNGGWKGRNSNSRGGYRGTSDGNQRGNHQQGRPKKCYVCGKIGCFSTRHSEKEQADAKAAWFKNKHHKRPPTEKVFQAFLMELEGTDNDMDMMVQQFYNQNIEDSDDEYHEEEAAEEEESLRRSTRRTRGRPRKRLMDEIFLQELWMMNAATGESLMPEVFFMEAWIVDQDTGESFISAKEKNDFQLAVDLRQQGIITTPGDPFEASDRKEIDDLLAREVFEFIQYDEEKHRGIRIFDPRMVREIKGKDTAVPYEKSRLVIRGFNDAGKETILTANPTIQRSSQRLLIALAPVLAERGIFIWIRDIKQAYTQSTTALNRTILAKVPKHLKSAYPPGTIMRVIKPLYGIPEAGTHWWVTYSKHHREKLGMTNSTFDPCLMISEDDKFGIVGMQTDDTIGLSDERFFIHEQEELEKAGFAAKPKERLTMETPITFNGCRLELEEGGVIHLMQKSQAKKMKIPTSKQEYIEERARGAYIASICQPEAAFDLSVAAQQQEPTEDDFRKLSNRLQWQIDNQRRGLHYVPFDFAKAKLFVFVDGSFANNKDLSSQLGYIIVFGTEEATDDQNKVTIKGNIITWASIKSKRVTRSALASELYSMVQGADIGYAINSTMAMITKQLRTREIPMILCTDSFSLYECLVKLGTTKEKRLMIDIMALRQSYERREAQEIRWINGDDNPADAMTKTTPNKALKGLIDTNKMTIRMKGWVERKKEA
ncbi:uncharacterized protein LMH87_008458 [Akanthomyces muscarius]|uniref:Reverse transcriptase Ty1/copia-type domain-containing protein n=1 Tax=Akanthomyces muscarius TaxID=2231603 RepID=A0A9W8QJC1_AKAMU|nr:uncharacterized protein LMH87_008458 [Akanthomyces muscarius]KAJ4159560.1 hypothetical protein LMH87_008458 [Akanthomyces muscarius]